MDAVAYTGFSNIVQNQDLETVIDTAEQLAKEITKNSLPSFFSHLFKSQEARDKEIKADKKQWKERFNAEFPMVLGDDGKEAIYKTMCFEFHNVLDNIYRIPDELAIKAAKTPSGKLMLNEVEKDIKDKKINIPYAIGKQLEQIWVQNKEQGLETRIHRTPCKNSRLSNIMQHGLDILPDNISSEHTADPKTVPDIDFTTAPISNYGQYLRYLTSLSGVEYHGADGTVILGMDPHNPQFSYIDPNNRITGSIDPVQIKGYVHGINGKLDQFMTRASIIEKQQEMDKQNPAELSEKLESHLIEVQQHLGPVFVTDTGKISEELGISIEKAKELCDSRSDILEALYSDKTGQFYYKCKGLQHSLMAENHNLFHAQPVQEEKDVTSSISNMLTQATHEKQHEMTKDVIVHKDAELVR